MSDIIPLLSAPDVPIMAGVPAILGAVDGLADLSAYADFAEGAALVTAENMVGQYLAGQQWGLFDTSGNALFPNALVLQIGLNSTATISMGPVEQESFVSYNKVDNPTQYQLGLCFEGSISDKKAQLDALLALRKGLDLITVRMPEYTGTSCNVIGVTTTRSAQQGADLLMLMVAVQEVRTYATTTYRATQTGYAAQTDDRGVVQAQTPTADQLSAIYPVGVT